MTAYPDFGWQPWLFEKLPLPIGYWAERSHVVAYLEWLRKELHVGELEDWYTITSDQLRQHHGRSLLDHYKSFSAILSLAYPDVNWTPGASPSLL